jgi:hypothetical protein
MLRPFYVALLIAAVVSLGSAPSHADVALSIEPAGADLSHLEVGETATVDVRLSELADDAELDTLAATVVYDKTLLSEPTMTAGPIVPDPLDDPLDYLTAERPGYAEATFLTFGDESVDRIDENGLFFAFEFTAQTPGEGQ